MPEDKLKILIIRLSSIGDILLATPFIRQIRKKFPNAQIDFLIKKEFEILLTGNPNINNIITFDVELGIKELIRMRKNLIGNDYQIVLDLHNNLRSIFIRVGINTQNKNVIKKNKFVQSLLVFLKINKYKKISPIPLRYLKVGIPFGVEDDGKGLELFWEQDVNQFTDNNLQKHGIGLGEEYFTAAPGAGFFTKKWPIEYYRELVGQLTKKYNSKFVVLGSDSEVNEGKELSNIENVIDLSGQLNLLQAAAVIAGSKALISNDSGLMHVATAVKVPVLAIFGSTVEEFGFFPFRSKSIVVENKNINCRPCSHIGRKKCPQNHFRCMKELNPELVSHKFDELMNR
jgi:heptosyltransferase-2